MIAGALRGGLVPRCRAAAAAVPPCRPALLPPRVRRHRRRRRHRPLVHRPALQRPHFRFRFGGDVTLQARRQQVVDVGVQVLLGALQSQTRRQVINTTAIASVVRFTLRKTSNTNFTCTVRADTTRQNSFHQSGRVGSGGVCQSQCQSKILTWLE